MYRHNIPLIPAEEIGYHLGLIVPPEDKHLFYKVRTSDNPPLAAGYGTNISAPEFTPNKALKTLGIPLIFSQVLASEMLDEGGLLRLLEDAESRDIDALLCFNHGVVKGQYEPHSGHVVVFDRVVDGEIRVVDASPRQSKWRQIELSILFDAIKQHGDENCGGIWYFKLAR